MPRNPVAALIQFPLGFALTGAGMLMLGWAAVAYFKVEAGFDAAMWVAENSPIALTTSPVELANSMIQQRSLITIGVAGFFAWLIGSGLLRAARINMSATDETPLAYTPVASPASPTHAGSTVFAHKMLSDVPSQGSSHTPSHATPYATPHSPSHSPSHAPRAARPSPAALHAHAGSASSPAGRLEGELEGLARLIGTDGKFTPQQREALAKLTPEQRVALAKLSKWAPSKKNAIIAFVVLFFALQLLPAIFSFLLNL